MYKSIIDPEYGRLVRARSRLGSKAPGYAAQVFGLPLVETTRTDTMATDGKSMFWNRTFVQNTTDAELEGVVLHEGLHVTFMHHLLRGDINPDLWNQAGDYVINLVIVGAGFSLPKGALYNIKFKDMSTKQVVKVLSGSEQPQSTPQSAAGKGEPSEGGDAPSEGDGDQGAPSGAPEAPSHAGEVWDQTDDGGNRLTGDDLEETIEEVRRDIIVAAEVEKVTGSGSVNISDGVLDAAKAATVDWREALADFLSSSFGEEATLARPNRRFIGGGQYFPSTEGVSGGDLVFAIDTSGSVSAKEAQRFADEIDSLRDVIKPDRVVVIYCDWSIQRTVGGEMYDEFDDYSEIVIENKSGGGTRFEPPFKLLQQEGIDPTALIYFTDGYASLSKEVQDETHFPVLWASTGIDPFEGQEPFGTFLKVEM
tara:strand:- start:10444 stop:11712 length:1269 start_codon:yes stop_codon:yes gene_type:complete